MKFKPPWGSLLGTVAQTGWEWKWRLIPQEHLKMTPSVQNPRRVFTSKEAVESVENLARVSSYLDIRLKISHLHKGDFRMIISYLIPFENNCINFKARKWASFANVLLKCQSAPDSGPWKRFFLCTSQSFSLPILLLFLAKGFDFFDNNQWWSWKSFKIKLAIFCISCNVEAT